MQNHLRFLNLPQSLSQFVSIFWVLISSELRWYLLQAFVIVILELSPLLSVLVEENIENFVEESKDDSLGVPFTDKGICSDRFVGHLNVTDFVLMRNSISGVPSDAWEGLPDNKLERVFDLIPHEEADIWELVVPMDDTNLFLLIFESNHAWEYSHPYLNVQNY